MVIDSASTVLTVNKLHISSAESVLVNQLSYELKRGETLAIVGESGSGKSISSLALLGLLPDSLTVTGEALMTSNQDQSFQSLAIEQSPHESLAQRNKRERQLKAIRGARIGMIFQEPMTALNPLHTIGKQINESLILAGVPKAQRYDTMIELLKDVNIKDPASKLTRYPHELSGGQRQRVMIATALAQNPDVLIADEPTTALDVTLRHEILTLLDRLKQQHGMAMLLISHDLNLVRRYSKQIIVMKAGEVLEKGSSEALFSNPSTQYTRTLISQDFGKPLNRTKHCEDNSAKSIKPLLTVSNLTIQFPASKSFLGRVSQWSTAVDNVSFELKSGQTLGIVGESGSGKTTLALALTRLLSNHAQVSGNIHIDNKNINSLSKSKLRQFRSTIQMVFQDPYASINPRFNVMQIVEEGLLVQGMGQQEREQSVFDALQTVHLPKGFAYRYPHELSGGQRQRVALARALVMQPKIIVLDEPTSALDSSTQVAVTQLLRDIQQQLGLSFIFISHDLNVVQALCQDILVMRAGKCIEYTSADELFNHPKHPYSQLLIKTSTDKKRFN